MDAVRLATARPNLGALWDRLEEVYGSRTVLTLEEPLSLHVLSASELTYSDVAEVVARLAGGLRAKGVGEGDRVAICTANRIDYALTAFAAIRAGAVAIPLHHHLKQAEVASLVERARAKFLVADPGVAFSRKGLVTLTAGAKGDLDRAAAAAGPLEASPVGPDDAAMILYTSGTTGVPKGATLTSRSLLAVARLAALMPEAHKESGVCGLPLAHVMGMSVLLLSAVGGAPMHWLTKFDAKVALDRIVERRATFFVGVPAMYAMLAEESPEKYDLSSVRLWASGADAMPPALVERFRNLGCAFATPLGQRLVTAAFAEVYGMVELSGPAILKLAPATPIAGARLGAAGKRAAARANEAAARVAARLSGMRSMASSLRDAIAARVGRTKKEAETDVAPAKNAAEPRATFGIPIPPYRVKVVDESGAAVKPGVVGELMIRGPGVTKGYDKVNGPETGGLGITKDGWLHTGDLAKRNRLGLISFVTRKKDVVKHGGFSVFPAEVEAQLTAHPKIAEAVVFGIPHPTKGAVPAAAIVLKKGAHATAAELLQWARENIASYKAPRSLAIVTASEIPRNANRKVLKDDLKAHLLRENKLQAAPAE